MTLVYNLPAWVGLLVISALYVAVACGGHVLVHRSFSHEKFIEHNEVAGFVIAVVGVLYAVLIGFLTIIVWEDFSHAEQSAGQEADAATDVWHLARDLPPASGNRIRSDVRRYADAVVDDEWPKMRRGQSSAEAERLVERLIDDVANFDPRTPRESNMQSHLLDRVQTVADLRRARINSNESGIPLVLWLGLIVGAVTLVGFVYLFGMRNFTAQLLITAALATVIGISFSLLLELDYPFRGEVSISPQRWEFLRDIMRNSTASSWTPVASRPIGMMAALVDEEEVSTAPPLAEGR